MECFYFRKIKMNEITSYEIEVDDDIGYEEYVLAKVVRIQDEENQGSLLDKKELSISHKFINAMHLDSFIDGEISFANRYCFNLHVKLFEQATDKELDIFSRQAIIVLVHSNDQEERAWVCTAYEPRNKRNERFNEMIEECLQKIDAYNLNKMLLKHMNSIEAKEEVVDFIDEFKI